MSNQPGSVKFSAWMAAMGATNRCLIGKIIGAPFKGRDSVDLLGS